MVKDSEIAETLAKYLLQIKAIQIQSTNPFQWASGWFSPIYCDNRKTLSHPNIRNFIKDKLAETLRNQYNGAEVVAGVATGAIAIGAMVADALDLPFIYVRSSSKGHGLGNRIEGDKTVGKNVVVVEDLISTGMSSLSAVDALREANFNVMGMLSIFDYGFELSKKNFEEKSCQLFSLSDYNHLLSTALEQKYIAEEELQTLKNWRVDPENWKP